MKKLLLITYLALASMASAQKVSELPALTGADAAAGDLLMVVDSSTALSKKMTLADVFSSPVPWTGVVITGQYGGTGVANTGKTITVGGHFTTLHETTFTTTGATNVTLPTSGTLATTTGSNIADPRAFREIVDSEVQAFAAVTGIGFEAKLAWENFLVTLSDGGIRDELVDALCTAFPMNDPADLQTLKLADVTVEGSPSISPHGMVFSGDVAERAYFATASTPVFTMAVDARSEDGISGNSTYLQYANSAGLGTAGTLLQLGSTNGLIMTANAGNYANSNSLSGTGHGFFISGYNNTDQISVVSNDNAVAPTVKGYGNGVLLITDSAGNNQTASAINRLTLGAFSVDSSTYQNPFKGTIRSTALFNRVLTDAEAKIATKALRMLDLRKETLVTYGDSQTAQLNIAAANRYRDNWPLILSKAPSISSTIRIHNAAVDSMAADLALTSFTDLVATFAPDGRGVTRCRIALVFGTNDIDDGESAATLLTRYQALAASARAIGMEPVPATVMHNTYFSGGQETIRTTFNTSLLATTTIGRVWDLSNIVGTAHAAGVWLDTLHLNGVGNLGLAHSWATGGFPRLTSFD